MNISFKSVFAALLFAIVTVFGYAQEKDCSKIEKLNIVSESPIELKVNTQKAFWFEVDSNFYDTKFLSDSNCFVRYELYDFNDYCSIDTAAPIVSFSESGLENKVSSKEMLAGRCFCESCTRNHRLHLEMGKKYVAVLSSTCGSFEVDTRITDDILMLKKEQAKKWYEKTYKKGDKLVLNNILFYPNSTKLIGRSKRELKSLIFLLNNNPKLKIEIQGHVNAPNEKNTDESQELSEGRAKAVYDYLIKKGISADRLSHQGYGNTQMKFPNAKHEIQMKKNRRVEILITG